MIVRLRVLSVGLGILAITPTMARAQEHTDSLKMDERARHVDHDKSVFGSDPQYPETPYDFQAQLDIYGAKHMNKTQRPLLELGRDLYASGPFKRGGTLLGKHNVLAPQLLVYGDFRTAAGYNTGDLDVSTLGNRLNLDIDFKITATERLHALFRPFEKDGQITRFDFTGDSTGFKDNLSGEPVALFFEGDLGAIVGGLSGRDAPFDMPIAAGLMPLLFHNGTWVEDAFTGGAFTIPARNSASLGWSNYDITFFFGLDRLSNSTIGEDNGQIFGVNTFIDAYQGHVEAGYAFINDDVVTDRKLHSVAFSYTRRYGGRLSNSFRYIGAFGSGPDSIPSSGHIFLLENSLITAKPSTVVPYFNLFVGIDNPMSAARDPGAGGILKNTGLNFETDALTAFPSLDATGRDAVGGALGLNLLGSNFDQQIVLEVAASYPLTKTAVFPGEQYGAGIRFQKPLTNAIIFRADVTYGMRKDLSNISGARLELRHKF